MADEIKKEEVKETKVEAKAEVKDTISVDGVELSKADAEFLIRKGAAALQAEKEAPIKTKKEESKKEEVEEDPRDKKLKELEDKVNQEVIIRNNRDIESRLAKLANSYDLTKDDPDTRQTIEDLVLVEAQKNPRKTLDAIYEEKVKLFGDKFAKKQSTYLKGKIEDAKATRTVNTGASASSVEEVKIDGRELRSGGLKKKLMAKYSKKGIN